jgi:hypothetical protein
MDEEILISEVSKLTGRDITLFLEELIHTPDPAVISAGERPPRSDI